MFKFDQVSRVVTAAVGALILSTLSIAAAVGPAEGVGDSRTVYAEVQTDRANG